ncbi:MAG TPA: DUF3221 domain-containing protein [Coriobacteriia bacterium]|nr:DUF3221 domain-containing protein [Coriobacteriia bacterium]
MGPGNRAFVIAATSTMLLLALVAVAGCAPLAPPSGDPSIRGVITTITSGDGSLGSILVEETTPQGLSFDKASLTVTKDSKLIRAVNAAYERIAFADLRSGTLVEVWTTGPVAESYPVQAAAGTLVVLE